MLKKTQKNHLMHGKQLLNKVKHLEEHRIQDLAPFHKALITQKWMAENFHDHITSNLKYPSSLDLNPHC